MNDLGKEALELHLLYDTAAAAQQREHQSRP